MLHQHRDVVEVRLDLGGVPCLVSDTAGLRRDSSDLIEIEGMKRARYAPLTLYHCYYAVSKYLWVLLCDPNILLAAAEMSFAVRTLSCSWQIPATHTHCR